MEVSKKGKDLSNSELCQVSLKYRQPAESASFRLLPQPPVILLSIVAV